jgi:acyl-coenzyme A thioesterase PaaI-like protein
MAQAIQAPQTTGHLQLVQRVLRGELPGPPIAQLIGFTLAEVGLGRAVTALVAERRHANPMGSLHGGIICDVADAAMGIAMSTTLEDDESFTTIDLTASTSSRSGTRRSWPAPR